MSIRRFSLMMLAAVAVFISSCHMGYEKTASGLSYKIIKGKNSGEHLKGGDFVQFNYKFDMPEKDTVFISTYGNVPAFSPIDTTARSRYTFMELLPLASVGDSIAFTYSIDTLKKMQLIPEYNKTFGRGDMIHGYLTVVKKYSTEQDMIKDIQVESDKKAASEVTDLGQYIKSKGIQAVQTKSGVFVHIDNPGDASNKADSGKLVSIMYRGTLLKTGKKFDTNMDNSMGHTDPYTFVIGMRRAIPGWDEALPLFGKGGKGTLYVPSKMAYGSTGIQGVIPPFSTLVFDVEVKDVQKAPAETAPAAPAPAKPSGK